MAVIHQSHKTDFWFQDLCRERKKKVKNNIIIIIIIISASKQDLQSKSKIFLSAIMLFFCVLLQAPSNRLSNGAESTRCYCASAADKNNRNKNYRI